MTGRGGRLRRAAAASAVAVQLILGASQAALAADPITYGDGSGSSTFGEFIAFKQRVTISGSVARVEVLISTPGSIGPTVVPLAEGASSGSSDLEYRLDLREGHIVPNTIFTVRFRVTDGSGATVSGPEIRYRYSDDRFRWRTLEGTVVRVHWVDGDDAFGRRALRIGDDAVAETAKLLGVSETEPIDVFVYGDQAPFYDALGPATRDNVGGQAHPDIRTLFALITPDEIGASWVDSVVPHELTHVVFATAVDNAYHDPPHWLNEGLAVYLSDGYRDSDRSQVEAAAKDGSIIPLDGLAGAFPTTRDRFFLAYAESVSAAERIVRVHGRAALVELIRSYAGGVSDDEAFRAALGTDVAGFEADWLGELGAKPPAKRGPRAAPAGPLPAGWSGPQPDPSFEVVGSQSPTTPGAPLPQPRDDDWAATWLVSGLGAIGAVLLAAVVVVTLRWGRRRSAASAVADGDGDNRLFGRPLAEIDGRPGEPPATPPSTLWSAAEWSLPTESVPDAGAAPDRPPDRAPDRPLDRPPDEEQPLHNPDR